MTSTLQGKLRNFVDELRVALSPQERTKLADSFYRMSIDWLEAPPEGRDRVLRNAKSTIIRQFTPVSASETVRPIAGTMNILSALKSEALKLKQRLDTLNSAINALGDRNSFGRGKKWYMSASAKARIAKAQRARWAKVRAAKKKNA